MRGGRRRTTMCLCLSTAVVCWWSVLAFNDRVVHAGDGSIDQRSDWELAHVSGPVSSIYNATAFDPDMAWNSLELSYAMYCKNSTVADWSCKWCQISDTLSQFEVQATIWDEETTTFGVIGYLPPTDQVVVAFRGTHDLTDFILDLEAGHSTPIDAAPGAEVHDGFLKAYTSVQAQVETAIFEVTSAHPYSPVLFTGHSLGAALTEITAVLAIQEGLVDPNRETITVYNFGCPRVGNSAWASFVNTTIGATVNYRRFTHERDLVPHLPPTFLGFKHSPVEIWEYDKMLFKKCDGSGEDRHCSDGEIDLSIADHLTYFGVKESCK